MTYTPTNHKPRAGEVTLKQWRIEESRDMNAKFTATINERFLGCPAICAYENLPAFDGVKAINAYKDANCPSANITEAWLCEACKSWHFIAIPMQPAGGSSGSQRAFTPKLPRYKMEAAL